MFELFDCFDIDASEVGLFWKDTTNESDGVFDCSLFPAVIGFAEVRVGPQYGIHLAVMKVFMSIVVCD